MDTSDRPAHLKHAATARGQRADDKRFAPRRGSKTPAAVTVDGAMESVACFILDMSTTGARLEFSKTGNPFLSKWRDSDRIWLLVRADRVMYDCRIIRVEGPEIGVKFLATPKPITRTLR